MRSRFSLVFQPLLLSVFAVAFMLVLNSCGSEPSGNDAMKFTLDGPCARCPSVRLDSSLMVLEGVVEVEVNEEKGWFLVRFDSSMLSRKDLVDNIVDNGYNAGMMLGKERSDDCCESLLGDQNILDIDAPEGLDELEMESMADLEDLDKELEALNDIEDMIDIDDEIGDMEGDVMGDLEALESFDNLEGDGLPDSMDISVEDLERMPR